MTSSPTSHPDTEPLAAPAPLVSRTVALSPAQGASLLALLPATRPRDTTSWVRRGEGLWKIKDRAFMAQNIVTPAELALFDTNTRMVTG